MRRPSHSQAADRPPLVPKFSFGSQPSGRLQINSSQGVTQVRVKAARVLVIEDDSDIATLLSEVLSEIGCMVCGIEATEADAVAAAVRLKPDLLIVDAHLRGGSGVAAVAQILKLGFIPHLFVSGNISSVTEHRPDAAVLQKPFRVPELARAVRHALATQPVIELNQAAP